MSFTLGENLKEPLIKIENVGKCYEKKGLFATKAVHAVDNVSFIVDKNEILGIVGESGYWKNDVGANNPGFREADNRKNMDEWNGCPPSKPCSEEGVSSESFCCISDPGSNFNPHFTVGMSIIRVF